MSPARQKELHLSGLLIDLVMCEDAVRRALLNFGRMTNVGYAPDGWEMPHDPNSVQVCVVMGYDPQDVADQDTGLIVMTPTVQWVCAVALRVGTVSCCRSG